MADQDEHKNEFNENFQFTELDPLNPEPVDQEKVPADEVTSPTVKHESPVRRNALIAIAVFVLIVLIYKFTGARLEEKKIVPQKNEVPALSIPVTSQVATPPAAPPTPVPAEIPPANVETAQQSPTDLATKLSNVETGQESMKSDLTTVTTQVNTMNTSIESLSTKIDSLMATVTALNEKLEIQSRIIQEYKEKKVAKVIRVRPRVHKIIVPAVRYYIQAVIPGRAWLVASNGHTLTVREGSIIPGYGLVKLIDPSQGRILTSSGHLIRFSQDDS